MTLRRAAAAAAGLALWLLPSALIAHKDDYLGDTFVFVTLDARELDFAAEKGAFVRIAFEVEF